LHDAVIDAPLNFEFGGVAFKFNAQVKLVEESEINTLTSGAIASDKNTVKALLVGWSGFIDEGKDVPFSTDTLNEMLSFGAIAGRLAVECINAQYRVTEKN
ncbi:hypothetical protein, partial [Pseudoalteromonas sp. NBT06-2]|uniref:hypothetical protein n=1 Tax=Pseudoalteromonas sp. NBT06-2 TaxID=2025950 RepID=UPI001140A03A